jgi:hypothetical protein
MVVAHLPKGAVRAIAAVDGPLAYLSVHRRRPAGLQVGHPPRRPRGPKRQAARGRRVRPIGPLFRWARRQVVQDPAPKDGEADDRGPGQPGPPEHQVRHCHMGRDQRAAVLGHPLGVQVRRPSGPEDPGARRGQRSHSRLGGCVGASRWVRISGMICSVLPIRDSQPHSQLAQRWLVLVRAADLTLGLVPGDLLVHGDGHGHLQSVMLNASGPMALSARRLCPRPV